MGNKPDKTNAMRILDQKKVQYTVHDYSQSGKISGEDVAAVLGEKPEQVFKTLVTVGKTGQHYVFLVPVCKELDLKKGASAVGEKYIEMIKSKDLLGLTGYIHGGCSPVGMKKKFPTFFDSSAQTLDKLTVSAGMRGAQLFLEAQAILRYTEATLCDIAVDPVK